jgi:hypothetical protein
MTNNQPASERWEAYRPSKALWFWSVVGAVVLTMIVGFTAGGWTTSGTANEMAEDAAQDARAHLVANLCVEKFVSSVNATSNLAELKEASSLQRDNFITDGGWVTIAGMTDDAPGAAEMCADQLMALESLPTGAASPTASSES